MSVLAYVPDLMDRSKVSAAVPEAVFVARAADLGAADVVIVDLARPDALDALAALCAGPTRVVAFGSHVDEATLAAARAAGCTEVLPRSQFFRRLATDPSFLRR